MLEAKLTIEIPGLASALESLAAAIARTNQPSQTAPAASTPAASGPAPVTPVTTTAPVAPTASAQPPVNYVPSPPVVPTSPAPVAPTAPAPSFTPEQVGKAGADLIAADPAKMPGLMALLQQFGVHAITELRPEQLGPFATALRGLGAKL